MNNSSSNNQQQDDGDRHPHHHSRQSSPSLAVGIRGNVGGGTGGSGGAGGVSMSSSHSAHSHSQQPRPSSTHTHNTASAGIQSALRQLGNRSAASVVVTSNNSSAASSSPPSSAISAAGTASSSQQPSMAARQRLVGENVTSDGAISSVGVAAASVSSSMEHRSERFSERRAISMDAAGGTRNTTNNDPFGENNSIRRAIDSSSSYANASSRAWPSSRQPTHQHHSHHGHHDNSSSTFSQIINPINNTESTSRNKEGWTIVPTDPTSPGRPPRQRSLHAAAVLGDSLYVFGGYDGLNRVNDFYEFHFPSRSWREIVTLTVGGAGGGGGGLGDGVGMGGMGGMGAGRLPNVNQHNQNQNNHPNNHRPYGATVTATGTSPTPRDRHAAVVHGTSFYVFGGFDGTSRVSDLYGFDVDEMVWREVRPRMIVPANERNEEDGHENNNNHGGNAGNIENHNVDNRPAMQQPHNQPQPPAAQHPRLQHPPPSPRHSHAAVIHSSKMYVFGGYDGSYRSDFHEFDLVRRTWRPVNSTGRSPRARYRSTACVKGDQMILFGGHDGTRHLADVHVFDFTSRSWSLLNQVGGVAPLPRDSHVSVVYGDSMYVFGGSTGSAMNDLYELNFHSTAQSLEPLTEEAANGGNNNNTAHAEDGHGPEVGAGMSVIAQQDAAAAAAANNATNNSAAPIATWRQVPLPPGGIAVHRFCHVGAVHKGSLYVFGGYDGSSRLNDFVRYDLAAENDLDTNVPPSTLLGDLRSFLDDEEVMSFADITFVVEGIPVRAHKLMLMRCPYFRAMLLGDMFAESSQSVVNLEIVRHPIFLAVLEYLYTDSVTITLESAMELFVAADCFDIPRLQAMCERRLLESMTVENAATIFHAADVHSARTLRDKALAYVLSHFEAVSKTMAFEDMARSNVELVFEILKSR